MMMRAFCFIVLLSLASVTSAAPAKDTTPEQIKQLTEKLANLEKKLESYKAASNSNQDAASVQKLVADVEKRLHAIEQALPAIRSTLDKIQSEPRTSSDFTAWVSEHGANANNYYQSNVAPHVQKAWQSTVKGTQVAAEFVKTHTASLEQTYKDQVAPHLGNIPTVVEGYYKTATQQINEADDKLKALLKANNVDEDTSKLLSKFTILVAVLTVFYLVYSILKMILCTLCGSCRSTKAGAKQAKNNNNKSAQNPTTKKKN